MQLRRSRLRPDTHHRGSRAEEGDRGRRRAASPAHRPARGGAVVRAGRAPRPPARRHRGDRTQPRRSEAAGRRRDRAAGPRPHRRGRQAAAAPATRSPSPCARNSPRSARRSANRCRNTPAHRSESRCACSPRRSPSCRRRCAPRRSPRRCARISARSPRPSRTRCRPGRSPRSSRRSRALGARVEANRASLQDHPVIADIERSLADLRHRLEVMAPIGDVASLAETVRTLSTRADAIASRRWRRRSACISSMKRSRRCASSPATSPRRRTSRRCRATSRRWRRRSTTAPGRMINRAQR